MKKILIILFIGSIAITACNNSSENSGNEVDTTANKDDLSADLDPVRCPSLTLKEVGDMVAHWRSIPHDNNSTIQQIIMDGKILRRLIKNVDEMKLYTAAYLRDDGPHKKNETTLIVGTLKRDKWHFCDIYEIFKSGKEPGSQRAKDPICPPPDPCGLPLVTEVENAGTADSTKK